jgi:hypothetical protein
MAEPVWYYARGDVEKGPLSTAQIRALAAAGKIRPEDFVWKEGMENWVAASEVPELLPADTTKSKERAREGEVAATEATAPAQRVAKRRITWPAAPSSPVRSAVGRVVVFVGLAALLWARGCDAISTRYAARLKAAADEQFLRDGEQRRRTLDDQIRPLQQIPRRTPADDEKLRVLTGQQEDLTDKLISHDAELYTPASLRLHMAAEQSAADHGQLAFWCEIAAQLGALLLAAGTLILAYSTEGTERWIAFAILAILVFSAALRPTHFGS